MKQEKIESYKNLLIKERKKVLTQLYGDKEKFGDLSKNEVGDMVDAAFNMYEKDLAIEMSENEKKLLRAIDGALIRIDNKKYGICVHCGKAINSKRLQAIPWTTQCANPKECKNSQK